MSGNTTASHMFIYKEDGKLEGCGNNEEGQLGTGDEEESTIPKPIMKDNQIEMICCGNEHSMMLKSNGEVLVCGSNQLGQLGLGREILKVSVFTLLLKDVQISKIQCGNYFSLLSKRNENEFITFGENDCGQLGIGMISKCEFELQTIKMTDKIVEIVCGAYFTILQLLNFEIYGFGLNEYAQIGTGDRIDILSPKFLFKDSTIKKIACGFNFTIYLKENGDLIGNGSNQKGQLAIEDQKECILSPTFMMNDKEIKDIFCGSNHTLFLKNNGELLGMGYNRYGSLGLGDQENRDQPTLIMKDKNIKSISCFGNSTMILKENGELLVFGFNNYGQLGVGNKKLILKPTLLMKKSKKISFLIMGHKKTPFEWSPETNKFYSIQFKIQVKTFLNCMKRNQIKTGTKIPKFVLHEIIKRI